MLFRSDFTQLEHLCEAVLNQILIEHRLAQMLQLRKVVLARQSNDVCTLSARLRLISANSFVNIRKTLILSHSIYHSIETRAGSRQLFYPVKLRFVSMSQLEDHFTKTPGWP